MAETYKVNDFYAFSNPDGLPKFTFKITGQAAYFDRLPPTGERVPRWTNSKTPGVYYATEADAHAADRDGKVGREIQDTVSGFDQLGFKPQKGVFDLGAGLLPQIGQLEFARKKLVWPPRVSAPVEHSITMEWDGSEFVQNKPVAKNPPEKDPAK